jgi:tetratricopeptide (TPR) repeat protein
MRLRVIRRAGAAALGAALLATAAFAQYREYYVRGRVVDTQKKPIPGVEIRLRDVAASRTYDMKTDKDGVFKLAGLPHGKYEVSFSKEGYVPARDEWKFEAPQDRMQKVDVPDVVLASQAVVQEVDRRKEAETESKEAAERIRKGDFDGAIALAQRLLEKDPADANALFFLGLSYARKKMCREAEGPLVRVTELSPDFPRAYFDLGVCYRQLGEPEKALAAFEKNLELEPANADTLFNAGLILFETNRIDEALGRFESGILSRPEDPELLEMAGRCYLNQGRFQAAVERLEKARAATTDPDKSAFLDGLIAKAKSLIR